jgi:hypothetical protein
LGAARRRLRADSERRNRQAGQRRCPGDSTIVLPDAGVRALPDELVDRVCPPLVDGQPEPPPWLVAQAEVIAWATVERLKPLIRTEVRAALRAEARETAP